MINFRSQQGFEEELCLANLSFEGARKSVDKSHKAENNYFDFQKDI